MHLITRDKSFYKTFFPLLLVIALQQLTTMAVNLADNVMLGRYTELALSGATVVNQVQATLQQFVFGIGAGVAVLGAQYWGQGRLQPIRSITSLGLKFGFLSGLLFFGAALLFPEALLRIFTNDDAVIAEGLRYLRLMRWTYLIFAVSNTLVFCLQSVETAFVGTVMSLSTLVINICLNTCFIYGRFGAPELGIVGAAVATLVSRAVELVIILVYIRFIDKKLHMKLWELIRIDLSYLKDYAVISAPLVLSGALWGVTQAVQVSILGHIDAASIAANSIACTVSAVFGIVGLSCANTASVTIGKTIGAGNLEAVKPYTVTMQLIFIAVGLVSGGLLFACKDLIAGFYNIAPETRALTLRFLTILSITTIGTCYEYPVQSGIIAGGGDTKYAPIVENLFMWLLVLPSAYLSAFVLHLPPWITFCCLKSDQVLKCIPNAIHCNRYKWVRKLTRDA